MRAVARRLIRRLGQPGWVGTGVLLVVIVVVVVTWLTGGRAAGSAVRARQALEQVTQVVAITMGLLMAGMFLMVQLLSEYSPRILLVDDRLRRTYIVGLSLYVVLLAAAWSAIVNGATVIQLIMGGLLLAFLATGMPALFYVLRQLDPDNVVRRATRQLVVDLHSSSPKARTKVGGIRRDVHDRLEFLRTYTHLTAAAHDLHALSIGVEEMFRLLTAVETSMPVTRTCAPFTSTQGVPLWFHDRRRPYFLRWMAAAGDASAIQRLEGSGDAADAIGERDRVILRALGPAAELLQRVADSDYASARAVLVAADSWLTARGAKATPTEGLLYFMPVVARAAMAASFAANPAYLRRVLRIFYLLSEVGLRPPDFRDADVGDPGLAGEDLLQARVRVDFLTAGLAVLAAVRREPMGFDWAGGPAARLEAAVSAGLADRPHITAAVEAQLRELFDQMYPDLSPVLESTWADCLERRAT